MSNKPKIYGFCDAGCRFETMHKEDFINACSLLKLNSDTDGKWYLETGKQYKIMSNTLSNISIVYKYKLGGVETSYNFAIPTDDKYAKGVVFKLLEASVDASGLTLVYEIGGIRYEEIITETNITLLVKNFLIVENADNVYIYNDDASIILELIKKEGQDSSSSSNGSGCYVDGVLTDVYFSSDPQEQINNNKQVINNINEDKANKDLSNVIYPQLIPDGIEHISSGYKTFLTTDKNTYYIVFPNGFKIYGGKYSVGAVTKGTTVTNNPSILGITFSEVLSCSGSVFGGSGRSGLIVNVSAVSNPTLDIMVRNVNTQNDASNIVVSYQICGY